MKKLLLSAFVICLAGTSIAQESPLWMRHCALSPDGTTIAFTYKGDIYTVPSTGGRATQITTNPAFDTEPVWSPDSKQIAFASDRMGSLDVFVVSSEGGAPQRHVPAVFRQFVVQTFDRALTEVQFCRIAISEFSEHKISPFFILTHCQ